MSSLSIAPDLVAAASGNLGNLGSALSSATAAAAGQTTAIAAPAADEVSAAITALFGAQAQEFQALSAKAAAFHDEFVNLLSGGAAQYVSTELTNAQQTLVNAVNAPAQTLLGHPLIGGGQSAAATNPANAVTDWFQNQVHSLQNTVQNAVQNPGKTLKNVGTNLAKGYLQDLALSNAGIIDKTDITTGAWGEYGEEITLTRTITFDPNQILHSIFGPYQDLYGTGQLPTTLLASYQATAEADATGAYAHGTVTGLGFSLQVNASNPEGGSPQFGISGSVPQFYDPSWYTNETFPIIPF